MSSALPLLRVGHVRAARNQPYRGRILAEIAQTESKELGDVILDIALADDLDTEFQRDTKQMTLERAVHRMSGELARDWGFRDRGTIAAGKAADLVLFDPTRVACATEEFVNDFPGEASRYVRRGSGYAAVIVNGEVVLRDGQYTGARPGRVV